MHLDLTGDTHGILGDHGKEEFSNANSGAYLSVKRVPLHKLVAGNLLVFMILLLLSCGVGEIYYRFVFDSTDSFGLSRVCARWFERHYHNNNVGARDSIDYSKRIAPGKRRVTFVGDSFTVGHGIADVERRFANILRTSLGAGCEIHVVAANGADTGQELATVMELLNAGYETDIVVLVYVLNDISDIVPEWQAILRRIYAKKPNENALLQHSYFLDTVYHRMNAARDPDVSNYFGFVRKAYDGPEWEVQQDRLAAMARQVRANGATFLVVTFPFLHAIGEAYAYGPVHEKLGALWASQGVPHLDLLPIYEPFKPEELVVGSFDAHPNECAHEVAAVVIETFLREQMDQNVTPRVRPDRSSKD